MKRAILPLVAMLVCAVLTACDAMSASSSSGGGPGNTCTITAAVTPASVTADHTLAAPGNQAQFAASSTVTGNCPLTPDFLGSWSTSDAVNTFLTTNAQNPLQVTATCRNAAPNPATISYSGSTRGHSFTAATLTCK